MCFHWLEDEIYEEITMSNKDFQNLILKALETSNALELAEKLKTSVPTIKRWASGETVPHTLIKESVSKTLEKQ